MTPAGGSAGCRIELVASGGQPREVARDNADDRVGTAVRQTEDCSDQLASQLRYALDYRGTIERAIGFVMARDGVDAVAAFNRVRTTARSSRRKISAVADETMRERR